MVIRHSPPPWEYSRNGDRIAMVIRHSAVGYSRDDDRIAMVIRHSAVGYSRDDDRIAMVIRHSAVGYSRDDDDRVAMVIRAWPRAIAAKPAQRGLDD
jgi:hypothetical protein